MNERAQAFALTTALSATPPIGGHPSSRRASIVDGFVAILICGLFATPSAIAQSRGELLYVTNCIACHTTDMHWRDKRAASNWTTLTAQVRRWQDAASLAWTDGDILDVSVYLNETAYHYDQTERPISSSRRVVNEPTSTLTRLAIPLHT
jgi:hypothetical protein